MRRVCLFCTLLLCLVFSPLKLRAQTAPTTSASAAGSTGSGSTAATISSAPVAVANPQTPEEFFARARQLSDLEASGIPFHLKATYVASGDVEFTGNGTYEEWWQSKDVWRKEATLGDYKYVEIKDGEKTSTYATSPYVPLRLRQAMDAVLIRIPADIDASDDWKMKKKQLSGVDLTVLSSKVCMAWKYIAPCGVQSYFTSGGVLRIHVEKGTEDVYNNLNAFRGLAIPANISVSGDGTVILTISVESLELLKPGGTELLKNAPIPGNLQSITPPMSIQAGPGVKPPKLIRSAEPIFPASERRRHTHGVAVVIACQIDASGIVREPHVVASGGAAFDQAAMDAVRQYRFAPAIENNKPEIVDANLVVDFHVF